MGSFISGTVKLWYQWVHGYQFECPVCEHEFELNDSKSHFEFIEKSPGLKDELLNIRGNPYDNEELSKKALYTEEGDMVKAVIHCPNCNHTYEHYDERVINSDSHMKVPDHHLVDSKYSP